MDANLVERESVSSSIIDLHQLAKIFINDFDTEYREVGYLSHASPYMDSITSMKVINRNVSSDSVHSKSPIHDMSGVFFLAETRFCDTNLVKLDINDNHFFRFKSSSGESAQRAFEMVYGSGLIVEIFYTHDFNFDLEEDKVWTTKVTSRERNPVIGHCTSCEHCNVHYPGFHKNPRLKKVPQGRL
ncbi:hypothetical protein DdX_06692 [Ditylenchus destructor]|uniref:Uncharacterized protein n=1 Tax=Ditylenchus destructor TaxID=166010 RepID=A0AAD4N523_9BILA|nr:hypothetical protein DdX_06692 [Ditylenchus destructor]